MQELIAIQQNGPKALGFFGTRNMGFLHQNLIEILSYAMVLTVRSTYPYISRLSRLRSSCDAIQSQHHALWLILPLHATSGSTVQI